MFSVAQWATGQSKDGFQIVNTVRDEQNPVISPDGRTLYVTIANHPQNAGGQRDPGDIWVSRFANGQWTPLTRAESTINNTAYNAVVGFSPDGQQLFLHGHYQGSGEPARSQGIAVSRRTSSGWSKPTNITIPYYHSKSSLLSGSLSSDGSVFVFSADTYGTYGVEDIYVSFFEGGKWTAPVNLGPTINTQFQELSPSISPDKRTLYFSSNGRMGEGSFDVFSATRLDDTWKNWTPPTNLGPEVNSAGRELFFRIAPTGAYAVYTSTLNSDGYGDVRAHFPEEPLAAIDTALSTAVPIPVDTVIAIIEDLHEADSSGHVVRVYGKVIDVKTGEAINARVSFASPGKDTLVAIAGADGYSISVPSTAEYGVVIEAKGYISDLRKLDIQTYELGALEMDFSLQPAEVGTTVNLENVLFAQSRTEILPESYPQLDLVVRFLKENPSVRIELSGHTDGRGVPADNLRLSQARVDRVKEYLVSKGIESRRISGKGYGGTRPIAGNDTEESRRLNRRVEFTIKKS